MHAAFCAASVVGAVLMAPMAVGDTIDVATGSTYYEPAYVFVQPGDVLHWYHDGGTHDVTSGEPCDGDSGYFYAPITQANPTFDWTVPGDMPNILPYYCGVGGHCVSGGQYGALMIGNGVIHMVENTGFTFDPPNVTVAPGDAVIWENSGGSHDVTFGSDCTPSGEFQAPFTPLHPLVIWLVPDDQPSGVIDYFCSPHCDWGMVGTITVESDDVTCPGDVNGDGTIGVDDLLGVISEFNSTCDCPEDVNGDGTVNVKDVLGVLAVYGSSC